MCATSINISPALERSLVGVLVHVLKQVPFGCEASRRNADLALVGLQIVGRVHRQDVESGKIKIHFVMFDFIE
jgi:hypothetical protein